MHRLGRKRLIVLGLACMPLTGALLLLRSPPALLCRRIYCSAGTAPAQCSRRWRYRRLLLRCGLLHDGHGASGRPGHLHGSAVAAATGAQTLGGAVGSSLVAAATGPIVDKYGFGALGLGTAGLGACLLAASALMLPEQRGQDGQLGVAQTGGYGRAVRRRPVQLLAALRFLPTAYYGTISLLMPLLIYRVARVPSAAAYYGTVTLLTASGCQLLVGRICDRFGRPVVTIGCTALMTLTSLATPLFLHSLAGLYICSRSDRLRGHRRRLGLDGGHTRSHL
jgi:hypothetical protein